MATLGTTRQLVALPPVIHSRLQQVRRRESRLRLLTGLVDALALFLVLLLAALLLDWGLTLFSTAQRQLLTYATFAASGLGLVMLAAIPLLKRRSLADVAADIDRSVASLEERWQTVTELSASDDSARVIGSPAMIDKVKAEAVARTGLVDLHAVVPADRFKKHQWFLVAAIASHLVFFLVDAPLAWGLMQRFWSPTVPYSLTQIRATSGDMLVARGEPIRLEAEATRRPRDKAQLLITDAQSAVTNVSTLSPSADDSARFTYLIDAAKNSFIYQFRSGDGQTEPHTVSVYDRPSLVGVDFRITPPEYTRMALIEKDELPAKVRAIEGSVLEITFTADQPLENFRLDFGNGQLVSLESASGSDPNRYVFKTTLTETVRFVTRLKSQHGLENERPPACTINVFRDQPPQVKIISPDDDMAVRPDDQVIIEWAGRDDLGISRAELIVFTGEAPDMDNAQLLPFESGETPPKTEKQNGPADGAKPADPAATAAEKPAEAAAATPADPQAASTRPAEKPEPASADVKADPKEKSPGSKTEPTAAGLKQPSGNAGKQPATAKDPKENPPGSAQPSLKLNAAANPQGENKNSNTTKSNANNSDVNQAAQAPNRTFRMPLDLADKAGSKVIEAKAKLDLSKLGLKSGEQLQYMIRVTDSRNTQSQGQTHANNATSKQSAKSMAQAKPSDPSTSSPADAGKQDPQENAAENTASPNNANSATKSPNRANAQASKMQSKATANSPRSGNDPKSAAKGDASKLRSTDNDATNAANPAEKSQDANRNPQNSNGSASQAQENSAKASSEPQPDSQGQTTGAPKPPNEMTMRELDVDQSQSSASSTMRLQIDEWAGSFEGQKRQKLELKIDPVLKQLDEALAKTLEHLAPVADALKQAKPLDEDLNKSIRAAQTRLEQSQSLVGDLVKTTDGTVYAFIGLQLVDITELHISPARVELQAVAKDAADKQRPHVEQAQFHVLRARELLADLTKKYETAKSDAKLAEDMQRIQKMYQIFIEEATALLGSDKPERNPRGRKMDQLELDEEFLEAYTELQKQYEKILAELAKALANDPRLLERYMNISRRSAESLRDQLTVINDRQKALLPVVEQLVRDGETPAEKAKPEDVPKVAPKKAADAGNPPAADELKPPTTRELVLATLARDLDVIADRTTEEQENLKTWLPTGIDADDARIVPLRRQATQVATTAALASTAIGKLDDGATVAQKVNELAEQLKRLESSFAGIVNGDNPQLDAHINKRLANVRQIQLLASAWLEKNEHYKAGHFNRALENDQHRLAEDTFQLVGKLDTLDAQLAGLPADIFAIGDELKEILRFDVLTDQMSAELSLRDSELPGAQEQQKNALADLARAEAQFDKLIDRIIEEDDKIPPNVPDIDNLQLPTLEDLLAQLQNEPNLADLLGVPQRPNNLQMLRDLLARNGGPGGMGMVSGPQAGYHRIDQARRDALRAIQRANELKRAARPGAEKRRWNTLASELEDDLRQGRGNMPPKQYRRAIERYFELISGAKSSDESPAPAEPKVDKPDNVETSK